MFFTIYDIAEIRFVGKLDGHADIFVNQWIECYANLRSLTPQMLYPQNGDRIVAIDSVMSLHPVYMGNESVLKIIINNTINLLFQTAISILLSPNHNSFRVLFDKIASYILFEKYIYILCPRTGAIPISIRHFPAW